MKMSAGDIGIVLVLILVANAASIFVYHNYIEEKPIVAVVDVDGLIQSQVMMEAGAKFGMGQAPLLSSAKFAERLGSELEAIAKKHNMIILRSSAVVTGQDVDLTDPMRRRLGVKNTDVARFIKEAMKTDE